MAVSTPVERLMRWPEMVSSPVFATYSKRPLISAKRLVGLVPEANGDPLTVVRAPVLVILYAETLFDPLLATKAKLPVGSAEMAAGAVPVAKGEPATGVSAPLPGFMLKAETVISCRFVAYTYCGVKLTPAVPSTKPNR